jgi:hypothetical protein
MATLLLHALARGCLKLLHVVLFQTYSTRSTLSLSLDCIFCIDGRRTTPLHLSVLPLHTTIMRPMHPRRQHNIQRHRLENIPRAHEVKPRKIARETILVLCCGKTRKPRAPKRRYKPGQTNRIVIAYILINSKNVCAYLLNRPSRPTPCLRTKSQYVWGV